MVRFPAEVTVFFKRSRPALETTQPPIQSFPGALSPLIRRSERETDHLPSSSAEFRNDGHYTATSTHACVACTGTILIYSLISNLTKIYSVFLSSCI